MKKRVQGKPPTNALSVNKWDDLPSAENPFRYRVEREGKRNRIVTVSKKRRRVLEGLRKNPVMCASRARISDKVLHLKKQNHVDIETLEYSRSDGEVFGVYYLRCNVTPLGQVRPKKKRGVK